MEAQTHPATCSRVQSPLKQGKDDRLEAAAVDQERLVNPGQAPDGGSPEGSGNLAIDSKLRGCDVVILRVEDIDTHGTSLDQATVRQRISGHPVRFEFTEQTWEAIDAYMKEPDRNRSSYT